MNELTILATLAGVHMIALLSPGPTLLGAPKCDPLWPCYWLGDCARVIAQYFGAHNTEHYRHQSVGASAPATVYVGTGGRGQCTDVFRT